MNQKQNFQNRIAGASKHERKFFFRAKIFLAISALLTVYSLLLACTPLIAQSKEKISPGATQPKIVRYDSSHVSVRNFSSAELEKYSGEPDFQYERSRGPARNWWEEFQNWLWEKIEEFSQTKAGRYFWDIVTYIAIGAVLIIVNYYLRKHGLYGSFYRDRREKKISFSALDENIHEMNFDELVARAASEKNFPLAVRYLYLCVLKDASDAQLIRWEKSKTNFDYVDEFADPGRKNSFHDLTLLFEYVWYGEFEIDEEIFSDVRKRFEQFKAGMAKKA